MARNGRIGVALWVAALLAVTGAAQEYSDSTAVVVVEVPVNVTRDGEPVTGLTAEDFEITDEGKKQEISGFDVLDLRDEGSMEQMRMMTAAARRHFVFVFDLSFSDPNAIARARQAASDMVYTSLHPTDLIAVATYSSRRGPQLVLNFTPDRRQVEQAFSTLGLLGGAVVDPLGIMVDKASITEDLQAAGGQPGGGAGAGRAGLAPDVEIQEALKRVEGESDKADQQRRVDVFVGTFGFLGQMLKPLDGRKHVVFLSEGFDASSFFGSTDQSRVAEMQQAVELGQIWDVDSDERFGDTESLGQLQEMLRSFKEADAVIHSIDIGGLRTDGGSPVASGRQDGLFLLAKETQGEFYRNYNDLGEAMGDMLESTSVTYVLAFQPSDPRRKPDSYHRLRVRLKSGRRGTNLSYRQGYFPPAAMSDLDQTQRNLQASQQMHTAAPAAGISASVLATPLAAATGPAFVPVLLQVPASEFETGSMGDEFPIELYAYAMDGEGEVKDYFAESLTFDTAKVGAALQTTGLKFYGHLDLEPGDYALRVMVRDGRTGGTSVEVVPLTVPEFTESTLAVMPPLFPEDTENWVMVRESEERAQLRELDYPFLFKTQPFVPAVHPLFETEQVVAVSLMASNPSGNYLEVDALVLGSDGVPVPGTFLRVLEREQDAEGGIERMIAAFEVPNLPSGEYQLVVTMADNASGSVESGTLTFALGQQVGSAARFSPPPWMPDLSEILGQLGPPEGQSIVKIDRQATATEYEAVLRQLAEGQQMGAVLRLTELEGGSLNPENPMSSLAQIRKVQWKVLERLARKDEELLLPAILLHKEAYSQYRLRKEPYLAVHARSMTIDLVDFYADKAGTAQARRQASRIITGMAAEVYGSGAHISAQRMFDRAVDLHERNGVALLGLGFMYENMGQGDKQTPRYDQAVEVLSKAVAVAPELHEARLRLAVNLGRTDQGHEGAQHLAQLIEQEDVAPWILSLSYQELARIYLNDEAYAEARRVLERGVRRMPEDSKLSLQLAYVYERTQQQQLAINASNAAGGASLAARFLYLQAPQLLEEITGAWTEDAVKRLPELAAALGPAVAGVGQ